MIKKFIALMLIAVMIANLALLGAGKIDPFLFWIIVGCCAIVAFLFFPAKEKIRAKRRSRKL